MSLNGHGAWLRPASGEMDCILNIFRECGGVMTEWAGDSGSGRNAAITGYYYLNIYPVFSSGTSLQQTSAARQPHKHMKCTMKIITMEIPFHVKPQGISRFKITNIHYISSYQYDLSVHVLI